MAFKTVFIGKAPDADPSRHRSRIATGKYVLHSCVVSCQSEALDVCRELFVSETIESVILCPGFSHTDVAEIFTALEGKVAVCVSRSDGPGNAITGAILKREFGG